jgi:hypothetical protein
MVRTEKVLSALGELETYAQGYEFCAVMENDPEPWRKKAQRVREDMEMMRESIGKEKK